jgi:hypothetical protein
MLAARVRRLRVCRLKGQQQCRQRPLEGQWTLCSLPVYVLSVLFCDATAARRCSLRMEKKKKVPRMDSALLRRSAFAVRIRRPSPCQSQSRCLLLTA